MPNVYLGPEGSETILPNVKFIGSAPPHSVSTIKKIEIAEMSDKSSRVAFFGTKKVFQIGFGYLSNADLATLKGLNALNQILRYKNQWEEDVWYNIVITEFSHEPERVDMRVLDRYVTSMTLTEV